MAVKQYEVYMLNLDPTVGHEISKTRPGVIISPDEMNDVLGTVIVAPLTSRSKAYPTRVPSKVQGRKGWVVLDQIRTLDKRRFHRRIGALDARAVRSVKATLKEMLVD